ncbi:hypothetical protein D3C85_541690 [compost metagenome]
MKKSTKEFLTELASLMEEYNVDFEVIMEPYCGGESFSCLEVTTTDEELTIGRVALHSRYIDSSDIRSLLQDGQCSCAARSPFECCCGGWDDVDLADWIDD